MCTCRGQLTNAGFLLQAFESRQYVLKPDGTWARVKCYLDSGNFVGDFINVDKIFDYGFTEDNIDVSTELIYETTGPKEGHTYGSILIFAKAKKSDVGVDQVFNVCKFPQ